jgi:hypothetical protein
MKARRLPALAASLVASAVVASFTFASAAEARAPKGFTAIFNGTDLSGLHGIPRDYDPRKLFAMSDEQKADFIKKHEDEFQQHWHAENGELVNDGQGPYATDFKDYGDVELLVDYKTVAKADSGIYLKGTPQVQIWDTTKEGGKWNLGADKGSGGLWNNSPGNPGKDPLVLADKPFGEWNKVRIIQIGARTTVYLNGKLVVDNQPMENYWDRKKPLFPKGPIEFQTHGGEIRWKNIFVRQIPPEEANKFLQKHGNRGFKRVFNGRDLKGWAGPVDNYEVKDGAIVCKPGKGGTIYYDQEYSDFMARLEFKLPHAGNNGLAIRYPGTGDTAYEGMCELQVLDNTDPDYKGKLDPRQFHGSAYGMVAAERGYLRPVGEWNYQEVTVKGSTVKVELNGTVILNADLGKVTDFMANHPHPGKDRASGYFGFAGHNDPVAYRAVELKKID